MEIQKKKLDPVRYIPLVIDALRSLNGVAKAAAVKDWISDSLSSAGKPVSEKILASGATKFSNDIRWARMYLVNAGLLEPMETAGYGNWKLTREGWSTQIDQATAESIYQLTAKKGKAQQSSDEAAPAESVQGELVGTASWQSVLKKILTTMPHNGFERLCAEIMVRNGLKNTAVTGQSGDGGVDGEGLLAFDTLCLIKARVAWQCKRFKGNKVSSNEIRDFRGGIDGRAQYGLIFSTSTFTPSAESEARRPGATPIELIGLEQLIVLLKTHAIGVECIASQENCFQVTQKFFDNYLHPPVTSSNEFSLA
jgi:restriction system protein